MNIPFLKALKQKLQVGNARSIHLNSYPGRLATRLDLFDLNQIEQGLADSFIDQLLTQPNLDFKISTEFTERPDEDSEQSESREKKLGLISKRLTSILYENEDNFSEHGIRTFGFGYPTFLYKSHIDPSKIISAPILIWRLEIQRERNEWHIIKNESN